MALLQEGEQSKLVACRLLNIAPMSETLCLWTPYAAIIDYITDYKIRMCVPNLETLFWNRTLRYVFRRAVRRTSKQNRNLREAVNDRPRKKKHSHSNDGIFEDDTTRTI